MIADAPRLARWRWRAPPIRRRRRFHVAWRNWWRSLPTNAAISVARGRRTGGGAAYRGRFRAPTDDGPAPRSAAAWASRIIRRTRGGQARRSPRDRRRCERARRAPRAARAHRHREIARQAHGPRCATRDRAALRPCGDRKRIPRSPDQYRPARRNAPRGAQIAASYAAHATGDSRNVTLRPANASAGPTAPALMRAAARP